MIAAVKQMGNAVHVFDESGRYKFQVQGQLQGYTSETVTVKATPNSNPSVYDSTGRFKFFVL